MTRRALQVLVAVVVGLLLLLLVVDRDPGDPSADRQALLPGLKALANDAQRISVHRSVEGDGVIIIRDNGTWTVTARDGYPADVGKLGQLIDALASARIVEEKTSNPANYAKLGVDDPANGGSGHLVAVAGPDFSYSVILGEAAQGDFRYARIPDQSTSYLIDRNPALPQSAGEWLEPDIVDIPASRVRRVSIAHADGDTIVIEKSEEAQTDFVVADVPAGRELSYATVGNGIAGALAGLELDDVRKRVDAPATTSVAFETWDGLRIAIDAVTDGESTWLAFAATSADVESASADDAARINERLSGWQYRVADYKKNLLVRRWEDLLKASE